MLACQFQAIYTTILQETPEDPSVVFLLIMARFRLKMVGDLKRWNTIHSMHF